MRPHPDTKSICDDILWQRGVAKVADSRMKAYILCTMITMRVSGGAVCFIVGHYVLKTTTKSHTPLMVQYGQRICESTVRDPG